MVTAREAVTKHLIEAAEHFPDLPPTPSVFEDLADPRDQQLALAITRTVMQRWITLTYVLDRFLRQPCDKIEPKLRGLLLGATAQLVFLHRLPSYAVVDESVKLARKLIRPGAAGLVNAVLRKVSGLVQHHVEDIAWQPAADRIPLEQGFIPLSEPVLPDPQTDLVKHLAIATSQRVEFVQRLFKQLGKEHAQSVCFQSIVNPPTVMVVENGFDAADLPTRPHDADGFVVFEGDHQQLRDLLAADVRRRVQDVASSEPVKVTANLKTKAILDYCAGRGTKSRQLAELHPDATVYAFDVDEYRTIDLRKTAEKFANLQAVSRDKLQSIHCDLILLDVPCSNSGVLARRPEARYRLTNKSYRELQEKQRQIVRDTMPMLADDGYLLYSTCSLTQSENEDQVQWIAKEFKMNILSQNLLLPKGRDTSYHDGSFHALLQLVNG